MCKIVTNVKVLFFGATLDVVGEREINLALASETKTSEVLSEISERFPRLRNHKLLCALNQQYAGGDEIVKNGDELAIFTAVSGG